MSVLYDYGINIAFDCGLSLQQDFDWLTSIPKEDITYKSNSFELYFEEVDFDAFYQKLREKQGIELVHETKEHSWGQRVIRLYDPDGHIIEVGECMKTVVNRFLSSGLDLEQTAERMGITADDVRQILK